MHHNPTWHERHVRFCSGFGILRFSDSFTAASRILVPETPIAALFESISSCRLQRRDRCLCDPFNWFAWVSFNILHSERTEHGRHLNYLPIGALQPSLCSLGSRVTWFPASQTTIGALIIRIGFWGPLDCNYKRNSQKNI